MRVDSRLPVCTSQSGRNRKQYRRQVMKLSAVTTKLTCVKSKAFRVLAAATLAGAALAAAAPAAQAQHIAFGVQFGGPRYVAPAPAYGYGYGYGYAPNYYERERFEAI